MTKPLVLGIDDVEDELAPLIPEEFESSIIHPHDEKLSRKLGESIETASIILLDQKFNDTPEPLSLLAADGASFVGHLRSWARQQAKTLPPIVLVTSLDDAFAREVPTVGAVMPLNGSFVGKEFRIAPALDVEWVQLKVEPNTKERISQLVNALLDAKEAAGQDGASLDDIEKFLEIPVAELWADRAREELRNARPPVTQKDNVQAEPCGAAQIIRWMCHRALPFPGMLFSDLYAAWALGLTLDVFRKLTEKATANASTNWLKKLENTRYSGPLNGFLGRRWWKSGIDSLVWELDEKALEHKDRSIAFRDLVPDLQVEKFHPPSYRVVTWTPDLIEDRISSIEESAQLRPPGWPAEAIDPWILKVDFENDAILQSMIESADLA